VTRPFRAEIALRVADEPEVIVGVLEAHDGTITVRQCQLAIGRVLREAADRIESMAVQEAGLCTHPRTVPSRPCGACAQLPPYKEAP